METEVITEVQQSGGAVWGALIGALITYYIVTHVVGGLINGLLAAKLGRSFKRYFLYSLIPFGVIVMWYRLADMPGWLVLICWTVVPLIIAEWKIFEKRGKPGWWIFIPVWNAIAFLIILFGPATPEGTQVPKA